jgi:hypothetical protein
MVGMMGPTLRVKANRSLMIGAAVGLTGLASGCAVAAVQTWVTVTASPEETELLLLLVLAVLLSLVLLLS